MISIQNLHRNNLNIFYDVYFFGVLNDLGVKLWFSTCVHENLNNFTHFHSNILNFSDFSRLRKLKRNFKFPKKSTGAKPEINLHAQHDIFETTERQRKKLCSSSHFQL